MRGQLKRNPRQAELIFPTLEINQNASANVPGMGRGEEARETLIAVFQPRRNMCPCGAGLDLASLREEYHPLKLMTPVVASLHRNSEVSY